MARAIWKGTITFGLVNIPVSLFPAESRPDIHLRMLDSRNHARVRYERVNSETGEEVPWDSIVRGYEYDENRYVVISEDEMENVKPEVTKTVEIDDFIDEREIDPIFFDRPYFLVPDKKHRTALKSYALLRETLRQTGKAGIAQVVIRSREYLCAMMVRGNMLVLNLLRFAQELRDASEFEVPSSDLAEFKISDKEIDLSRQLVEAMSGPWKPERYHDTYRSALMEWIETRIEAGQFEAAPEAAELPAPKDGGKVVDLMDYLKKSVEQARKGRGTEEKPAKKAPAKKAKKAAKAAKKAKTAKKKTAAKRKAG